MQLGELQDNYDDIIAAGGSLIAISTDNITATKATVADNNLTFTVLSDTGKDAIGAYNVVSQNNSNLARPSVYIIKTDGTIGWKSLDSAYSRVATSSIISALKGLE